MAATFPIAHRGKRGYDTDEVDEFLAQARAAYDGAPGAELTALDIRRAGFSLRRGGYRPDAVDGALERLEDVFSTRERDRLRRHEGDRAHLNRARETAQVILNRLGRERGHKFSRVSVFTIGYNRSDVDRFAARLSRYFSDGMPLSAPDVRSAVFRQQRGGYREAQVDLLLDAVVDVMLAVR